MKAEQDIAACMVRLQARIGLEGPRFQRRIEAGALIKYARATGQTDPAYIDENAAARGPHGMIIAPPTYVGTFCNDALAGVIASDVPFDIFLHSDDVVKSFEPIRAGDTIDAVAVFAEAFIREGRNGPLLFQFADMALTNQHGRTVATVRVGSVSFNAPGSKAND